MKKFFYNIFAILLCFMIFSNAEKIESGKLDIYDFDTICLGKLRLNQKKKQVSILDLRLM